MNRLTAMDAFVRVVNTGSFTGAARQLRVGQPAISEIIAQLEERVGVKLLFRTTQGLTAQSQVTDAMKALKQADDATNERSIGELEAERVVLESTIDQRQEEVKQFRIRDDYADLETCSAFRTTIQACHQI